MLDVESVFQSCFAFGTFVLHGSVQEDFKLKLLPQSLLHPAFRGDGDGSCLIHVLRRTEVSKQRAHQKEVARGAQVAKQDEPHQSQTRSTPNSEIAPSLGRNLSSCAAPTGPCSSRRTIDLVERNTEFEDRLSRVDIRVAKNIQVGRVRLQPRLDLYNVFNANTVLRVNTTFGSALHRPLSVLAARFIKVGLDVRF